MLIFLKIVCNIFLYGCNILFMVINIDLDLFFLNKLLYIIKLLYKLVGKHNLLW